MLSLLASAFVLGLVFNAAPGPVFAETVRRGARGGFRPALAVQIGSLAGDAIWALLGLVGTSLLLKLDSLRVPIGIASASYLLWLAWEAWRESSSDFTLSAGRTEDYERGALRSGILLSITNPQNIAYWAALGAALSSLGLQEPTDSEFMILFSGFMMASIVWAFLFAGMVHAVIQRAGKIWARITYRLCALTFLLLAISTLRKLWPLESAIPNVGSTSSISGAPVGK